MKRQLIWSRSALEDFKSTLSYIAQYDRTAARKVRAAIDRAARSLAHHPTGRRGRVAGAYEKSVTGLPYVVAYALDVNPDGTEAIVILRIIHTSRDWKPGAWPAP